MAVNGAEDGPALTATLAAGVPAAVTRTFEAHRKPMVFTCLMLLMETAMRFLETAMVVVLVSLRAFLCHAN